MLKPVAASLSFPRALSVRATPQKAKKILHLYPDEQRVFQLFQFDPVKFGERVYQDLHEPTRITDFDAYYRPYYTTRSPKQVSVEAFRRTHYVPSHPVIYLWLNPGASSSASDEANVPPPTLEDIQFLLWEELVRRVVLRKK